MSWTHKIGILALVGAISMVAGCKPLKGSASPEDYTFLIHTALESAEIGAMIGRNAALDKGDFAGCVTAEVLGEAASGVKRSLSKRMDDEFVVPALKVDLDECRQLGSAPAPAQNEKVAAYVEAFAGIALSGASHYASKLEPSDCKKSKAAQGAVAYLQALVKPIADEVAYTDGVFEVPEVKISLSECSEE